MGNHAERGAGAIFTFREHGGVTLSQRRSTKARDEAGESSDSTSANLIPFEFIAVRVNVAASYATPRHAKPAAKDDADTDAPLPFATAIRPPMILTNVRNSPLRAGEKCRGKMDLWKH